METSQPVARYKQVAEHIRRQILAGDYAAGQLLPSEEQLGEEFNLSRVTINKAVAELRTEGLVVTERGRGTYVRPPLAAPRVVWDRRLSRDAEGRPADPAAAGWTAVSPPTLTRQDATVHQAELLAITAGSPMYAEEALYRDEESGARRLVTTLVPFETLAGTPLEDLGYIRPPQLYTAFEKAGHTLAWRDLVRARMPLAEEVTQLQLPPGTPVLHITRVTTGNEGRPLLAEDVRAGAAEVQLAYDVAAAEQAAADRRPRRRTRG